MSKKGLISSLIIGLVVTLSLGIYTIVSVVAGNHVPGIKNTTISMAFRTGDAVSVLDGYNTVDGTLTVTLDADTAESPLVYDQVTGKYTAGDVDGGLTAVVKSGKRKTTTYIMKFYKQGEGTSESDAFILANATHLKEFAEIANSRNEETPEYTKLVADIDISQYNWKPIGGHEDTVYSGTFDGNGHTISGLTINVDINNYADFLTVVVKAGEKRGYMDLGLFGNVSFATIKNLNVKDATITVGAEVYEQFTSPDAPATDVYDSVRRVSIGTIAGNAYQTTITGAIEVVEEVVTKKASVISRINGFSYSETARNGVGGIVGSASLVRVSDYAVNVNVINNHVGMLKSYIGGVVGYSASSYASDDISTPAIEEMASISGVEVDFTATALYNNSSYIGGVVGAGYNTAVVNSNVKSFKVVDTTAKSAVDYDYDAPTIVGGIASSMVTNSTGYANGFISKVENVNVANIDVYMLGGDVAGAIVHADEEQTGTAQTGLTVKDVTVSGVISANSAAGLIHQNNAGSEVSYTKVFETAVVNIEIKANMSAGVVFMNAGKVAGFVDTNTGAKTSVKVVIKGMGALILNANDRANVVKARTSTYAAGFVAKTDKVASNVIPTISNFDVVASIKDSINMAGIAYKVGNAVIDGVDVNATIVSYNYSKAEKNFSTTYMVAGAVCQADAGATLRNINVIVNANKDVDTTKMYGATFFGGLVARYTGDNSGVGLTIDTCEVSGDVYFNYSDERAVFASEEVAVFTAGGLIGSISTAVGGAENVDAFLNVAIVDTSITNAKVDTLKITAGFVTESINSSDAWRVRAIGALVGVLNANYTETLDLSTCKATGVEIVADEDTFTFNREQSGGQLARIALGAGKVSSYGSSYAWYINGSRLATIEPTTEMDITYRKLA